MERDGLPRLTLRLLDLERVASLGFVPEPLHLPSIHLLSGSNEQASADFILHPAELRLTPFWNAPDELQHVIQAVVHHDGRKLIVVEFRQFVANVGKVPKKTRLGNKLGGESSGGLWVRRMLVYKCTPQAVGRGSPQSSLLQRRANGIGRRFSFGREVAHPHERFSKHEICPVALEVGSHLGLGRPDRGFLVKLIRKSGNENRSFSLPNLFLDLWVVSEISALGFPVQQRLGYPLLDDLLPGLRSVCILPESIQ